MNKISQDEAEEYQQLVDMSISILKYILNYKDNISQLQSLIEREEKNISSEKRCHKLKQLLKSNQNSLERAYEIFDQYGAQLDEIEGYVDEPDEVYITKDDIVVKTYTFKCVKHSQKLIDVKIIVDSTADDESFQYAELVAGKCQKCNAYYVMAEEVERAKLDGILLCRLVDEETYRSMVDNPNPWPRYNPQSILMQFGYSVSKERGLTEQQRHTILAYIIDKNVCPKTEVLSFLKWFIREREDNPRYADAIVKWKRDIDFVVEYQSPNSKEVHLIT